MSLKQSYQLNPGDAIDLAAAARCIENAHGHLSDVAQNRVTAIIKTKLEEAHLWLDTLKPETDG